MSISGCDISGLLTGFGAGKFEKCLREVTVAGRVFVQIVLMVLFAGVEVSEGLELYSKRSIVL